MKKVAAVSSKENAVRSVSNISSNKKGRKARIKSASSKLIEIEAKLPAVIEASSEVVGVEDLVEIVEGLAYCLRDILSSLD